MPAIHVTSICVGPSPALDHMVGSLSFDPVACEYEHTVREAGLSDHSAMRAELELS